MLELIFKVHKSKSDEFSHFKHGIDGGGLWVGQKKVVKSLQKGSFCE